MIVKRFINQLMSSNCYVVSDEVTKSCIIIDPGSEKSKREIEYIESIQLKPVYIILTHEHSDHTWGCNALIDKYDVKLICSEACKKELPVSLQSYFRLYYDDPFYFYVVKRVDITIEELNYELTWAGHHVMFISTPGHSRGSICFTIDKILFTGDTIMQCKPFLNKRDGSKIDYVQSVEKIHNFFNSSTHVYPGHADIFLLKEGLLHCY